MDSCILFHGPGARQSSLDEAGRTGRLLHEPFGDAGLKVDEAREFVSLLQSAPLGSDCGVLIAGPMDRARPKSADALLKSIEQFNKFVHPILWAIDIGGVRNTIASRCVPVWCPATGNEPVDEELETVARDLLAASLAGDYWRVPQLVGKMGPQKNSPARYTELLAEVTDAMLGMIDDPKVLSLWVQVRDVTQWHNPTSMEIISAFLNHD